MKTFEDWTKVDPELAQKAQATVYEADRDCPEEVKEEFFAMLGFDANPMADLDELTEALFSAYKDQTPEWLAEQVAISGSHINYLRRCLRVYNRAHKRAPRWGYVGVGCITFAEMRLIEFQRRARMVMQAAEEAKPVVVSTYTLALDDGRYEFGRVECATDRRKDRMVAAGVADTFEDAEARRKEIAGH